MHTNRTGRVTWTFLSLFILTLTGCGDTTQAPPGGPAPATSGAGPNSGGRGPRLMFITNGTSDWWNAVEKGMRDGAKEFGAEVEMRRPDSESAQQIQKIEDVLSLPDVQGVAISVLEADSPGIADKMRRSSKCREGRDHDRL